MKQTIEATTGYCCISEKNALGNVVMKKYNIVERERKEYSRKSRFEFYMIIYILIKNVNFAKMGRETNH